LFPRKKRTAGLVGRRMPADLALALLRLTLGGVFVAHGVKHFINRDKTIRWTQSIGLRAPRLQWGFMTFAEIGIGIGLIAGFATSVAAAALVAMMLVAYWTVHRHAGFFVTARPDEGWEYVLTLAAAAVALAGLGPGEWSLDHAIGIAETLDGAAGMLIAAGGGVSAAVLQILLFYRGTGD
jgi:putative oxidoreductase